MKNKIELKKSIFQSIIVIIIILIIFSIYEYYQYKIYTINFNNKIGSIAEKVIKEYPNISQNDLMQIINSKEDINIDFFEKYGIELDVDTIVLKNDMYFKYFFIIGLAIIIVLSLVLLFIFLKYNKNKDKVLKEITKYIEELNNRNYKLSIDDNTEDELSILKNEIYKTTIMLKEIADNSIKDKINLKDSLSDISHQLKTPLTSINVMLDNILDNPNMEQNTRTDFIKNIKKQIINVNFLINSLLKLSKLDVNAIHFINKEVNIETLINQSIENTSIMSELKEIEFNVTGNKEDTIFCDIQWQKEAITNILKNAIEHSANNSTIDISYEQNSVYSKIEIKDYGVGISPKDLPHIFDRFYKGKNSSDGSVGIGLALAKAIIEKNNGNIEVSSIENISTTFTIKYLK